MKENHIASERGVAVVTLRAGIDTFNVAPEDFDDLLELAGDVDPPRLVIDLAGIDGCNNQFVAILIEICRRLKERPGWRFGVFHVSDWVRDVLEVTKLNAIIDLFETREDAITSYAIEPDAFSSPFEA